MRESESTVLRWLKRYAAEGPDGLTDAPREWNLEAKATRHAHLPGLLSQATRRTVDDVHPDMS